MNGKLFQQIRIKIRKISFTVYSKYLLCFDLTYVTNEFFKFILPYYEIRHPSKNRSIDILDIQHILSTYNYFYQPYEIPYI